MERIPGLRDYVETPEYRRALGLLPEMRETYRFLAQGEYNVNYAFTHPRTGQALVLRVNRGSQLHLRDQIGYEYRALRLLEPTGRTPRPLYADGSKTRLPCGVLVMEYLPGRALDCRRELPLAADILADIHGASFSGADTAFLLSPERPLTAILNESRQMADVYLSSPLADSSVCRLLERMLTASRRLCETRDGPPPVRRCINTELNSTNFLISGPAGPNSLVDWEKPLLGDPAQDAAHFLAPTTTFWKTDVLLTPDEEQVFFRRYLSAAGNRFDTAGLEERTRAFLPVTCMRGAAWCAMAWVEYQRPGRPVRNESTARRLERYLDPAFLELLLRRWF